MFLLLPLYLVYITLSRRFPPHRHLVGEFVVLWLRCVVLAEARRILILAVVLVVVLLEVPVPAAVVVGVRRFLSLLSRCLDGLTLAALCVAKFGSERGSVLFRNAVCASMDVEALVANLAGEVPQVPFPLPPPPILLGGAVSLSTVIIISLIICLSITVK